MNALILCAVGAVDPNTLTPEQRVENYRKRVARKFIGEMAKEPGAITLSSGLVVQVLARGTGTQAAGPNDSCEVHYTGTLRDGSVFDSSRDRGQPATFTPQQVIKAWTEALQLMRVGDRWKIYVPPELGYGAHGAGPKIPPHSALVFDMELLSIKGGATGRTAQEVDEVLKEASGNKADL
ncbi:putative FKBP-type peptidylprolyl cis-trans isomerase [Trypanosoma vivax]|nr:putative FKBP-type peptidylprolyl cis-trans isomerase [Trypanosoma vivax]